VSEAAPELYVNLTAASLLRFGAACLSQVLACFSWRIFFAGSVNVIFSGLAVSFRLGCQDVRAANRTKMMTFFVGIGVPKTEITGKIR
jgi:hypothetical protein